MSFSNSVTALVLTVFASVAAGSWISAEAEEGQFGIPKGAEGIRVFKATEHPFYSGEFHLKGERATLIGSMRDTSPWDHLDYAGKRFNSVKGTIEIDVNELTNTGRVLVEFFESTDRYRIVFERFAASMPFQDGGIATRGYEHGDSGHGDPLYLWSWNGLVIPSACWREAKPIPLEWKSISGFARKNRTPTTSLLLRPSFTSAGKR